ncbi:MAG: aldolase [Acidiferrobacteraceae bacterium]|jgi:ribulose-5-phosphate 4-epimerase/fuculose-1-phosphate aldolase|nr:aldolase [Acidiferrobacteraceae bacterium]MBT4395397.1 aldolase [Acidiferrobacteraceae bacterium]MBT4403493.1 aldolase [Acidiferrobacteraceae bacterium]MBT6785945.1 aldolase [Acidiferrobacteraceae bacterium]MBT7181665.1 aldolase [Acidiferrobacteraceae bacterium]
MTESVVLASAAATQFDLDEARVDLAAALRWAHRFGLSEGVDNHFSMAVPDDDGVIRGKRFLINPYGWHWSEITASSLVLCDENGNVLAGDNEIEDTAFFIHSRIHANLPNAIVVLHTHMPYTTALTLLDDTRLEMVEQNALLFDGRIAYDNAYSGLALDCDEGDRIAAAMGEHSILMMANHGVAVSGTSVALAFNDLYYLERAAMFQVLARSTGRPFRVIPDEIVARTRRQVDKELPKLAQRHFTALKRMLDRQEPDYRN